MATGTDPDEYGAGCAFHQLFVRFYTTVVVFKQTQRVVMDYWAAVPG